MRRRFRVRRTGMKAATSIQAPRRLLCRCDGEVDRTQSRYESEPIQQRLQQRTGNPLAAIPGKNEYAPDPCPLFIFAVRTSHADEQGAFERAVDKVTAPVLAEPSGERGHRPLPVLGRSLAEGLRLSLESCKPQLPKLVGIVRSQAPDLGHETIVRPSVMCITTGKVDVILRW